MFFSSLIKLDSPSFLDHAESIEAFSKFAFEKCTPQESIKTGFYPPVGDENAELLPNVNGCFIFCVKEEVRKVPADTVKERVKEEIAKLKKANPSMKIGKDIKNRLKEEITQELLPYAFSKYSYTYGYYNIKKKAVFLNSASMNKADVVKAFIEHAFNSYFEFGYMNYTKSKEHPNENMANWLQTGQTPSKISAQFFVKLRDTDEGKGTISYKKQDLNEEKLKTYLKEGKTVAELELDYNNQLTFILSEDLTLKSIKFGKSVKEEAKTSDESEAGEFYADFCIMQGYVEEIHQYLVDKCLGGQLETDSN